MFVTKWRIVESTKKVQVRDCYQANTTATAKATKTPLGKQVRAVLKFITLTLFHTICLMLGNSSGVDSKGLYLNSEKENRKSFSLHVLHKT